MLLTLNGITIDQVNPVEIARLKAAGYTEVKDAEKPVEVDEIVSEKTSKKVVKHD
jgi:hypothetical protein